VKNPLDSYYVFCNILQFNISDTTTLFRVGLRLCHCNIIGQRDSTKPRLPPLVHPAAARHSIKVTCESIRYNARKVLTCDRFSLSSLWSVPVA